MPSSLSSLLADTLGLSEEHAHTLLERLAQAIRDHADETGVHVSGLGTFRRRDGALTFEPEDDLAQRVNQRYEGLEAEAAPSPPPPAEADDSSSPAVPLFSPRFSPPPPSRLTAPLALTALDESPPGPPAVWEPRPDGDADEDASDVPPSAPADAPSAEDEAGTAPQRPARDRSTGPRVAAAVFVVLFLLGAGWLLLGQQGIVSTPQSVVSGESPPPTAESSEGAASSASSAPTDTAPADTAAAADDTSGAPGASSDEPPADARWGLVVASRDTRTAAEGQATTFRDRLADRALSVTIQTGEADNTTRHRVVVGDFSSRDAALEAMDEYDALLPEGVWLLRLE